MLTALTVQAAADDPPPFGTVLGQWNLPMSGAFAGAGITWRRDSGLLYLMDQGYSGPPGVWRLKPSDPTGTIRRDSWVFANFGTPTRDIPYGIAWDADSDCYWISQILDGSVDSGCYLLRMTWSAGAWRWRGTPADSWRVDSAPSLVWIASMVRCRDRVCFLGAEVGTSTGFLKFNPYTKTRLGTVQTGYGSRGVCLTPPESSYVIGSELTRAAFAMWDSTGQLVREDTSATYGPADLGLVFPAYPNRLDTVLMYCICSDTNNTLQKVSSGFLWGQFPSLLYRPEIGCISLSPSGVIDSGQTIFPILVARCYQGGAEYVRAYVAMSDSGGLEYEDSTLVATWPAGTTETLAFTGCVPEFRDSATMTGWISWAGDSNPSNDTIRVRLYRRVTDIAIPWFQAPRDTFDSTEDITFQGRVENRGNTTLTFDVNTWLSDSQSTRKETLTANGMTLVGFGPYRMPPGIYIAGATAVVPHDQHPSNNTALDTIVVRGPIEHDYGVLRILEPTGTKDTLTLVAPSALVKNYGMYADPAAVFFRITGPDDSTVVFDSMLVMLAPGDSTVATFPEIRFTKFGSYVSACSVHIVGDQDNLNDKKLDTFQVAVTGVSEATRTPLRYGLSPISNPCRDYATIRLTSPLPTPYSLSLYDATGRVVLSRAVSVGREASSVVLDLRALPVGVYVLRLNAGTSTYTKKIMLQH
jgi:hypothetical protein